MWCQPFVRRLTFWLTQNIMRGHVHFIEQKNRISDAIYRDRKLSKSKFLSKPIWPDPNFHKGQAKSVRSSQKWMVKWFQSLRSVTLLDLRNERSSELFLAMKRPSNFDLIYWKELHTFVLEESFSFIWAYILLLTDCWWRMSITDVDGYIDVGDGCWRPNELVTSLRCWWPI